MGGGSPKPASAPIGAVFLSYASQDAAAAQRVCTALRSAGVEVWFDQSELRGGDAWDQSIRKQIKTCALFLPLISKHTHERAEGYFRLEWKLAVDRSHLIMANKAFLVPVVIDETADDDENVPERFREVQWTRLPAGETPPEFATRIQQLLSGESPQSPTLARAPAAAPSEKSSRLKPAWLGIVVALAAVAAYVLVQKPWITKPALPLALNPPPHSIAVLPFVNMSGDKEQEYFADGLAEELLNLLSQVPDLSVAARTSAFYFKGQSDDVATIAHKLRVANILEGSVRKASDRIRVTVQLIHAENGYHIWSNSYDRNAHDIFKVQDEIAAAVVKALRARLLPTQRIVNQHRTDSLDAYTEYLLGNQLRARDTTAANQQALAAYRRAVVLDPGYAAAYSGLAVTEWRVADQSTGETAAYQRGTEAAERAIALAPASPDGYWARGTLRYLNAFNWSGAEADFEEALKLDPNSVRTLLIYARLRATLRHIPEAMAMTRKGLVLDPLSVQAWDQLSAYCLCSGQLSEARDAVRHTLLANGESGGNQLWMTALFADGPNAALAALPKSFWESARWGTALAQHTLGHEAESQQALDDLIRDRADSWAYQIAATYAWRVEADKAFEWLERAYRQHDAGLTRLAIDGLFTPVRDDPRYRSMLHRMNLPESGCMCPTCPSDAHAK